MSALPTPVSITLATQIAAAVGGAQFNYGFVEITYTGGTTAYVPLNGLTDAAGNIVNPATNDTLLAIKTQLAAPALPSGAAADGTDVTGASMPAGGTGIRGWLSASYGKLAAIVTALGSPFQAGGNIGNTAFGISGTLPAFAAPPTINLGTLNGAAQDGTDVTGASMPAGGTGIRGWLSAGYAKLAAIAASLAGTLTVSDGNNAAFSTAAAMTANQAIAAARSVGVVCTSAGSIVLTLSGGETITLPVSLGWQTFPFAATTFAFANSAAGSVYNLG